MRHRRIWPLLALGVAAFASVALAACGGDDDDAAPDAAATGAANGDAELMVQVASYEVVVGTGNRFIVGALTDENNFVSYGTAELRFFYLGTREKPIEPQPFGGPVAARFIGVPGEGSANPPDVPTAGPASEGRGVYLAEDLEFDRAGFWGVQVELSLGGVEPASGTAAFEVYPEARVPAAGEQALLTQSPTLDTPGVALAAIDSRALSGGLIPDPELHSIGIADAVASGKPTVIVFATPVFCVSKFCGPVTDMIAEMQKRHAAEANFIHIEIWQNYDARQVNPWATDWLATEDGVTEPWFFLVGSDGTILERWDNLASVDEIESALAEALAP